MCEDLKESYDEICAEKVVWPAINKLGLNFKKTMQLAGGKNCNEINQYFIKMGFGPGTPMSISLH